MSKEKQKKELRNQRLCKEMQETKPRRSVCHKTIELSPIGLSALTDHTKGKKT